MFSSRRFFNSLTRIQKTLAIHQALYLSFQTPKASRLGTENSDNSEKETLCCLLKKKKKSAYKRKVIGDLLSLIQKCVCLKTGSRK